MATAALYDYVHHQARAAQLNDFEIEARNHASEIQAALHRRKTQISTIAHFFAATDWVSLAEYQNLLGNLFSESPDSRRMSWVQVVNANEANKLKAKFQESYGPGFHFYDYDYENQIPIPATATAEEPLLVVGYTYPTDRMEHLIGRNLRYEWSYPLFSPALETRKAYVSGFMEPSPPADQLFILLTHPVVDSDERLLGVLMSASYVPDLFTALMERFPNSPYSYQLTAHDGSNYQFIPGQKNHTIPTRDIPRVAVPISLADRDWQLTVYYPDLQAAGSRSLLTMLAILGVSVTILLASLARLMTQRNADLSRRVEKQTEQLEHALEDAQAATHAKSQFLANMSHEMRTPLNGIAGLTELALREELSPKLNEYLKNIKISSKHLISVINDVLDFSKIDAGYLHPEQAPFQLDSLLTEISSVFQHQCEAKGLIFSVTVASEVPDKLIGDKVRLNQILINLLSNAIKFTHTGSVSLNISAERLRNHLELEFSVVDSGIGIASEKLGDLFSEFTQADASTTREYGGTGLGLSIAAQLCELMGGSLTASSTPGEGSHFTARVLVQADLSETTNPIGKDDVKIACSREELLLHKKILVAEDNAVNQFLVEDLLKDCGADVTLATNGREAVNLLASGKTFDLVLMDINMPEQDGLSATRQIRLDMQLTDIPIIALTANVSPSAVSEYLASGMNDHIPKPFELDHLLEKIGHLVATNHSQTSLL